MQEPVNDPRTRDVNAAIVQPTPLDPHVVQELATAHQYWRRRRQRQLARRRASKVVRETFSDRATNEVWIPSIEDGKRILLNTGKEIEKVLATALGSAAKNRFGSRIRKRTVKCDQLIWAHFFWPRFDLRERLGKGRGKYGLYKARVNSSYRLHQLFGESAFFQELRSPNTFSFIAPKAFAVTNWQGAGAGAIQLRKGDYVAILGEPSNSAYVVVYRPRTSNNSFVEYQGRMIQGEIGYCAATALEYETPFTLQYSPRTNKATLCFACWVFNNHGVIVTFDHLKLIMLSLRGKILRAFKL